jgi:glycerol-3-phosphate dehydrogenase
MSIEADDRGEAAAGEVAGLMAGPLGWDPARERAEADRYRARLAAEREAQATEVESVAGLARIAPRLAVQSGL